MALNQQLNLKQEQKLVMTPQLQMAIKLLQMPALDLQEFIDHEMLDNPFLGSDDGVSESENTHEASETAHEEMDSATALEGKAVAEDGDMGLDAGWDSMYDSGAAGGARTAGDSDEEFGWEQTAAADLSLKEHLQEQLGMTTDDRTLRFLGAYLIDAIDDAGYLRADVERTAQRLHVEKAKVEEALAMIQSFDPAGVGARGLEECLKLQLEQEEDLPANTLTVAGIVLDNLEYLARKDFAKLAKLAKCSSEEIQRVCETIKGLTPKPGLKYGSDVSSAVIPDVTVSKGDNGWKAELNAEAMPKVLVNQGMSSLAENAKGDDKNYMTERMSRAQWLIKSLEQRARTIYKVSNAIVKFQSDFFDYGAENLQPMTLKTIAETVEAHESTVSRVTNGKYMQTPMGVFEMKYFFSSAIGTTGGTVSVASQSVRQMIKRLIGEEDSTKPLSDEKLVSLLKREGVDVARRTVAKYREGLGIPSSSKRRVRL